MLIYLLKFSACLAILLLFYKLFLERESMHSLKRYYLLGTVLFSLTVPSLVFTEYIEIDSNLVTSTFQETSIIASSETEIAKNYNIVNISVFLWTIYGLGVLFFCIKFVKNLAQIVYKIRKNPKLKNEKIVQVLLLEKIVPHTFLSYIFLNKKKYDANEIPKEVLLHEETHAKQRHSLDVLFIELLLIVLWFNPLIYLTRKSIKLNHEFLADRAVIENGMASSTYQKTLLSYMTPNHHQSLASAINYSSIKKRFTIMKTRTSKKAILLKSILLIPLLALMLYGFSEKQQIETNAEQFSSPTVKDEGETLQEHIEIGENIQIHINQKGQLLVQHNLVTLKELPVFLLKYNSALSKEQREKVVQANIITDKNTTKGVISDVEKNLIAYGVAKINILVPEKIQTSKQNQNSATRKQMVEYNKLAKHYNDMPNDNMRIYSADIERLKYIYDLMSPKQKQDAEPFPDFPVPPPAPKAPRVMKGEKSDIPPPPRTVRKEISDVPKPPTPPTPISPLDHVIAMAKKGAVFYLEEKEITSDQAIAILKKNKKLNISTKKSNSKRPIVHISAKPIRVKN